ncbi:hypothetical protein QYE76_068648 [Lolium multiflorum]|uniref:DUF4283 domain-containing protein n=1 Tax=Lolium multiflorum TaxID=4521 RepID=A0AAD8SFW6_LOLMU|nr:hypothetical protein QYE76_068648 [Lolium multiflorum]
MSSEKTQTPHSEINPEETMLNKNRGSSVAAAGKDGASTTLMIRASSSGQRKDKQIMNTEEAEANVRPIIVNMVKARGLALVRLLAVGVFLSVIAITSKQMIGYMRNIWKVRGNMETNQFADKRFLIEFSEEGDFEHVICGSP